MTGCAHPLPAKKETPVDEYFETKYGVSLSKAELQVMKAWTNVANATREVASTKTSHLPVDADVDRDLMRKVRVDWIGTARPLLLSLSQKAKWRFVELGKIPPINPVITVKGTGTIMLFLAEIGSQIDQADVKVDPTTKTIILHWKDK